MKGNRKPAGTIWIAVGLLLITAALCFATYNLYDGQRAAREAGQAVSQLEGKMPTEATQSAITYFPGSGGVLIGEKGVTLPDYVRFPDMEMPVETVDGMDYIGILCIPALELELPIISRWSYPNLKIAPCRYSGSAYLDDLILCGHNFASHFGNLKNLSQGDLAIFTDMDGNVFTYEMVERETLLSTEIEEMESGDWDLTLFTCTVGGKSRVTIRFERKE